MATSSASRILRSIQESGWHSTKFSDYEAFQQCMSRLGQTINVTHVEVKTNLRAMLFSSSSMPLHTDHSEADLIAWYCVRPSDENGKSLLLDSRELLERMTEVQRRCLADVRVRQPNTKDRPFCPLLSPSQIYYASWLVETPEESEAADALRTLQNLIAEAKTTEVALTTGDALIIDNRWILHGRQKISEMSTNRLLIRHWIALDRPFRDRASFSS